MIKIVLFDVANTLLGKPDVFREIELFCHEIGVNVSIDFIKERHKILSEVSHFPNKTSLDFYIDFNYRLLLSLGVCASKDMAKSLFKKCTYKSWVPYEDCIALNDFKYKKGILSNWDKTLNSQLTNILPDLNFEIKIVSSEVGYQKPDKNIFQIATKKCGVLPEEIAFIGDSIRLDYQPSIEFGIKSILIDRENAFPGFNGLRIESLHELTSILDKFQ